MQLEISLQKITPPIKQMYQNLIQPKVRINLLIQVSRHNKIITQIRVMIQIPLLIFKQSTIMMRFTMRRKYGTRVQINNKYALRSQNNIVLFVLEYVNLVLLI